MIDVKIKYQASIFIDGSDIIPTSDKITEILPLFRDKKLIPGTFSEISANNPKPQTRLRLATTNNEWEINLASQKIDIIKSSTDAKGSNLGELEQFCPEAYELGERIIKKYSKNANRISMVSNFLLEEMEDKQLKEIYTRLFKAPAFYEKHAPVAWNWRTVTRKEIDLNGEKELFNVILTINRLQGDFGGGVAPFDRIELVFDINTYQGNKTYRFDAKHLQMFYKKALGLYQNLFDEIGGVIYE